ncbi:MAG TPA: protein translocase subunit SecD [Verrucomicrobiae bacterium]
MKQNNFGWFILVVCIVLWALYEVYPPTSRDLVQEFSSRASNKDAAFTNILDGTAALMKTGTNSEFAALEKATGTNDLDKYFPKFQAANQLQPNLFILNRLQRDAAGKIKLGLDLQGGTQFLVQMDTSILFTDTNNVQQREELTSGAVQQAIDVLRKRIDKFGVAEPVLQAAGPNQILVQLPGLSPSDKARAKDQITKSAFLEFRMVNDHSREIVDQDTGQRLKPVPPSYEVLKLVQTKPGGIVSVEYYVVKNKAEEGLSGDIVRDAHMGYGSLGAPEIDFELKSDAALKFGEVTRKYAPQGDVDHNLSIVLDGQLYSVARITGPIETGNVSITGSFTRDEVMGVVNVLQNPLRAPLSIISSKDVEPTLGKDNIRSGINASMYAVLFVSIFMLGYYFLAGLAANVALITNLIILLGVMCAAGVTFTLPGIAGGVLTVGMAVDANVLIYERIREELAKGKSLRGAIDAGYARAFGTIFDSHVTTLISSVILIMNGTGEIKGFGVTLTIGVAASLFTALVVTRLIFNFLTDRNIIKSLPMLHIIRSARINFMKTAAPLFFITWIFAIAAICYGGIFRGEKLFGVDFLGGDSTTFSYAQKVDQEQISAALATIGEKDAQVQYQTDMATGSGTLQVTSSSGSSGKVQSVVEEKFPQAKFQYKDAVSVGASVGRDIQRSAVIASLLAMLGILVYVAFRYEFSFAIAAVAAVLHDVLLTLGVFCIANAVSGRQFSATVVAAVLTIIGFSINDKIVIFDRIREDLKLGMRGTFKEIINAALNQTLSRTIITSGTVFIATAVLLIWGGGAINDFAFTFLIGIVTGTYSSIYVASVIVLWWHKGERPNIGASQVKLQNTTSVKV